MNATGRVRRRLVGWFGPQATLFIGAILTAVAAVCWGVKIVEGRLLF